MLKVHFDMKNLVRSISHVSMAFDVVDVFKTSDHTIIPDETLIIDADLALCSCLPSLSSGDYIITGKIGKTDKKLHLNGEIYKM